MSKFVVLFLCIGVAAAVFPQLRAPIRAPLRPPAAPQRYTPNLGTRSADYVTITRQTQEDLGNGAFTWAFQNSDGTEAEQRGYIKNLGTNNEIQVMEGSYTYYSTEGQLIRVRYIADEGGFQILEDNRV